MDMIIRAGIFGLALRSRTALGFTWVLTLIFSPGIIGEERTHTVQSGETFYSIARTLGVKVEELMKHNGITDPTRLQAGLRLKVPSSNTAAQPQNTALTYRVVRGDTLFSIARRFSVTVEAIRETNNLSASYVLREGDSLRLPLSANPPNESGLSLGAGTGSAPPSASASTSPAPSSSASRSSSLRWPINAREINYMTGKLSGVMIPGTRAESVTSLTWGTVLSAGPYRGFGRVVIIQVDGGYLYVYGGCESISVKEGDRVAPGTEIGKLGIDVVSGKPQLFFMVYKNNAPIDPARAPRA